MRKINVAESVSFLTKIVSKVSKMIHFLCCFLFKYCAAYNDYLNPNVPKLKVTTRAVRMGRLYKKFKKMGLYVHPIPDEKSGTILKLIVAVDDANEN